MISLSTYQQGPAAKAIEKTIEKYDFKKIRTVREAIENKSPSLIDAKKIVASRNPSDKVIDDMLKLWIATTSRSFNVSRNIDPVQIPIVVEDILEDFYYLRLSEVYYVLKQVRKGQHEKMYERIDVETVLGWFRDYVSKEREPFYEQENYLKHDAYTSAERSRLYEDFVVTAHKNEQDEKRRAMNNNMHRVADKMSGKGKFK